MDVIYLDTDDDVVSICDRLDWTEERQVLLVLPQDGGVLQEGLDLVRLRRHVDRRRLEVGLVTADPEIARQAQALGIPVFATAATAQKSRRGWWRGRRRRERVGIPTVGGATLAEWKKLPLMGEEDREEMQRRMTPPSTWRHWLFRYAAIVLFFITMSLLFVAFSYVVPGATVTLEPETMPLRVTREVLVDPALEEVDDDRAAMPGRLLTVTQSWQTEVETTGTVEVPSATARGRVVFVNELAQEVPVPAGTRVSTSGGTNVVFQTLEAVTVPGVTGGTAEVDVVAIEPGPQGNVDVNQINRIQGSLSSQLEVRNLEPTTGGGVREEAAVAEADRTRLRSQVLQFLQAAAVAEMEAQLTEQEFLARDSLRIGEIYNETYSQFAGERAQRLALEIRADVVGTAVNTTEASGLVYQALAAEVPAGFALVPGSIDFESGEVLGVDDQGRVSLAMIGEGVVAADLEDLAPSIEAIAGQEPEIAVAYLYEQLPLRAVPTVDVWPTWFDRMPYLPTRIQTIVQAEE